MSKLAIATEKRQTSGSSPRSYVLMRLKGLIDAPNFFAFEASLEKLVRANENCVVLDFRNVQYINSTGISSIIRFHSTMTERGGRLLLIQVSRNVGLTMHLLGVTSIVPFLKNLAEAEEYLETSSDEVPVPAGLDLEGEDVRQVPVLAEAPLEGSVGSVIVAVPIASPFTSILRNRLSHLNGNYHLVHSISEVQKGLTRWEPDLIVLDHRLDGVDEFIETLKVDTQFSLTSVIVLYEKGANLQRLEGFRVWENDYLIDPFELMNLFALTESELRRVPRDRQVFAQQVHFQFTSATDTVSRGLNLANRLIQRLGLSDTDRTALYAAFKEGVDNAVLHGNRHHDDAKVTVNFLVDPNKVTFIIEDDGAGFDYEYYLSQIDSDEAFERAKQRIRSGGRGGLGILLMHKCSDRLEYTGAGNVIRIEKNLPPKT
ncbi:MAG: ATP-binding protein [Planctomycetota bacterium]